MRHILGRESVKNKIYIRPTLQKSSVKKPKDEKARKRNTIVNFRVSPDEKERIDARIAMTGMDKAEFFIESCLYQAILVRGNIRTFREIEREMKELAMQIDKIVKLEDMNPGQQESLRVILEILEKLFGNEGDR